MLTPILNGGGADERPEDALTIVLRLDNYRRIDEGEALELAPGHLDALDRRDELSL